MPPLEAHKDPELESLVQKLSAAIHSDHLANIWEGCRMPGQRSIAELHDQLLSVLFPGVFGLESVAEAGLNNHLRATLDALYAHLSQCIALALDFSARQGGVLPSTHPDNPCAAYEGEAKTIAREVLFDFPQLRSILSEDLVAAYEGDPAASSVGEVLLSYPCVQAIATHRIAHALYTRKVPILPRMLSEVAHSRTGIDIHPGATIGPGFFIDHGTGVVIGETTVIGRHVKLYQGVTLGARSFDKDDQGLPIKGIKRHPNIEDHVTIYAGATILGGDTTIGKNSVVGGSCWVTTSIPPNTVVMSERAKLRHR
jgi:serine O-acetyltransferase